MSSIPCDVVILPTTTLAQSAIALSKSLDAYGALFTLQTDTYIPHISLYMTQLKVHDIEKVKKLLSALSVRASPFELVATDFMQAEGYIDANYMRTKALDRLQMEVIAALNPIREGMREKDKARMLTTEGVARENLERYGYRSVGELFRPHLTFTRFAGNKCIDASALPDLRQFDGGFISLGLFEMGDNGTCVRRIATFDLVKQ